MNGPRTTNKIHLSVLTAACLIMLHAPVTSAQFRNETRRDMYARAFLEEGRHELERGSYFRAIRLFSDALQYGAELEAYKLRGLAHHRHGNYQKALDDYSTYISSRYSDAEGLTLRGDTFNCIGQHQKALMDFETALKQQPDSVRAMTGKGISLMGMERYQSAGKVFRAALDMDAGNVEVLTNLGVALALMGRADEGISCFEDALASESDPKWRQNLQSWTAQLAQRAGSRSQPGDPSSPAHPALDDEDLPDQPMEPPPSRTTPSNSKTALSALKRSQSERRAATMPSGQYNKVADPSSPEIDQVSGTYEASYLGVGITLRVRQDGESIAGSLRIDTPVGQPQTYHFTGSIRQGRVRAAHHSGHVFEGHITGDRRLVGTVTTSQGQTIPLNFSMN